MRWLVVPPAPADAGGRPPTQNRPLVIKLVAGINQAVEAVMEMVGAPAVRSGGAAARAACLDDSRNPAMGILVRKHVCSACASVILHGMWPSRMAGFVKNTAWSTVLALCP